MSRTMTILAICASLSFAQRPHVVGQAPNPPVPAQVRRDPPAEAAPAAAKRLAAAGAATIIVPANLQPYPLVKVSLSQDAKPDDVDWEILYANDITKVVDVDVIKDKASGSFRCDFAGPPGAYRVTAWITAGGVTSHATATVTIPAPPTPAPVSPPLDPSAVKYWVVAVFDVSTIFQLPAGQRAIYASTSMPGTLAPLGGYWKRFDTTYPDVSTSGPPWAQAALKAGLPALVVVDSNGAVVSSRQMPNDADEAWVISTVKNSTSRSVQ